MQALGSLNSCSRHPSVRLVGQSRWTFPAPNRSVTVDIPASDWSNIHGGHSQPQIGRSQWTPQRQTGRTVTVDTSSFTLVRKSLLTLNNRNVHCASDESHISNTHISSTHSQNQIDQTVAVDILSDWSNSHSGDAQPQSDHTVSVDTLQPQTDQTVPVDVLNLRLITRSQWTLSLLLRRQSECALQPSTDQIFTLDTHSLRRIRQSPWTSCIFKLIRYSQWTPPSSDWSDSPSTLQTPTDQTVPADTAQPQTDQQTHWTH
jgi:hypothetical protein